MFSELTFLQRHPKEDVTLSQILKYPSVVNGSVYNNLDCLIGLLKPEVSEIDNRD